MGQLATQAQNVQMQAMNPQRQMKQLLEKSWPRIAAVMPQEMSEKRLYQMYVSTINREPQLASCSVESVLSCFMRCTSLGLEPSNVNGLGMAYILPFGNKNYRTGQKEATFILGYRGIIDLAVPASCATSAPAPCMRATNSTTPTVWTNTSTTCRARSPASSPTCTWSPTSRTAATTCRSWE